jgi:hypothetical protein
VNLPGPDDDIRLTSTDIELIRGVLVACSQLLAWAERWGGAQFRAELHDAAQWAKGGRTLGQLRYDVNLSIDHLDFADPIRSRR